VTLRHWRQRLLGVARLVFRLIRERRFVSSALNAQKFVVSSLQNRRMIVKAIDKSTFVKAAIENEALMTSTLQQPDFSKRALADRAFLAAVLDNRAHIATQLSIKQTDDQRIAEFKAVFDRFASMSQAAGNRLPLRWEDRYPCLDDRTTTTPIDRHYLYHPAWAARVLARTRPEKHVDISSTVAFCSIVSAFIPVDFYDFRPARIVLDGLYCGSAELTRLPFADGSICSLSCMHVLEHIGLGRYGDPLDPDADRKSIDELVRVLAPGGDLLVATPVGQPRIQFNAHRVFDHEEFVRYFAPLELVEFALIEEKGEGGLVMSASAEHVRAQSYGCGCFWLRKPTCDGTSRTMTVPYENAP
jgi:SAM-dependent methyltransferase